MKRLFALVLAVVLVMSMATTAFAASGTNDNTGSITINKAHPGFTYGIYQILVMDSYDTSINSYIYSPVEEWADFIDTCGYLVVNENGTVKWSGTPSGEAAAAFVADAKDYAVANGITPDATMEYDPDTMDAVKFTGLNLGYYMVDSTVGAICSLDSVMPDTIIEEKNLIPTLDKKVRDQEGNFQESISESIGKPITFGTKITAHPGTTNLVYIDRMQSSLDLVANSIKVYYTPMAEEKTVDPSNYDVVTTGLDTGITFEVHFDNDFMETITATTDLTVVYQGVLNEAAIIAGDGNLNEGKITYGDEGESAWDPAKVYTYKFGIVKTDISNHILQGAEFELYHTLTGGNAIALVEDEPAVDEALLVDDVNYYRPATAEEQAAEGFVSAKIKAGKACIWGIRAGVDLYLEETDAPDGYNKLAARHHISALTDNNIPTFTAEGLYEKGGVEIENLAGAQLPQTGGIGTTLFYIFGGLMATVAVVLLVTKKRMST